MLKIADEKVLIAEPKKQLLIIYILFLKINKNK
jgi:hypothetical protein